MEKYKYIIPTLSGISKIINTDYYDRLAYYNYCKFVHSNIDKVTNR